MSLTREQWTKMWNSIKRVENQGQWLASYANTMTVRKEGELILREVNKIKKQIEEVIGQME